MPTMFVPSITNFCVNDRSTLTRTTLKTNTIGYDCFCSEVRKRRGSARFTLRAQLAPGAGGSTPASGRNQPSPAGASRNWDERVELATPFGVAVRELLSLPARVATVAEQCRTEGGIPQAQSRFEKLREAIANGNMRSRLTAMQEAHFYPRSLVVPVLLQVLRSAVEHARERNRLEGTGPSAADSSRPKNLSTLVLPDRVFDEMSRSQAAFSLAILLGQGQATSEAAVEEWRQMAVEALIEVLQEDLDPAARAASAGALGHVGSRCEQFKPMLVSPLLGCFEKQSEDWIVRLSAAASLGLVRAREALLLFIEELNSHEVNSESGKSLLVQTVICALGDLAYADYSQSEMDQELLQRSVRAIERFTRSEDVLVRISVTESLGHWCRHSSKARAAVESLLLDPNENVAKTARFALDTYAKQDQ